MGFSEDLKTLSLHLLEREPPVGPVVLAETYRPQSLAEAIETLARPGAPLEAPALANLCLKYAFAYVYPERHDTPVSLDEVTSLVGQFVRRRGGCRALRGQDGLRRLLLHHGFALQMLLDLPKTVALLTALAGRPAVAAPGGFTGLDLGAGTGILLVGHYLWARRSGLSAPGLTGIEHLAEVAGRADGLLSRLGIGRVLAGDATREATYAGLVATGPITCVSNETLPSVGRRLYKEPFVAINRALFAALGRSLAASTFLPDAVWASDRAGSDWVRLSRENGFAATEQADKPLRLYFMRDVELGGRRVAANRVGEDLTGLVCPGWREALSGRW